MSDRLTTAQLTDDLASRMARDPKPWLVARECVVSERPLARADLLCMRRRLDVQPMLILEVKISRADLLSDLRSGKWRNYLGVAALAFAFPANLADLQEIPAEAALIVRNGRGWRWERYPKFAAAPLPSPYLYRRMALTASDQSGRRARDAFGQERPPASPEVESLIAGSIGESKPQASGANYISPTSKGGA